MKRLFVSAALLPLMSAAAAQAETKISTATTAPVATATLAGGQPDDLLVEAAGSIRPTSAGVAVTLNSNNTVKNAGTIGFTGVNNATGVLVQAGRSGALTNTGSITLLEDYTATDTDKDGDLDGAFAEGTGRFGVRLTGSGAFTGDIRNEGAITVEGNDSRGVSLESRLQGNLVNTGSVGVTGDRTHGISATSVSGQVRILGAVTAQGEGSVAVLLGDVDGGVVVQNTVTSTGYRYTQRVVDDAARAKLDADDLKQGGGAVRITGNLGKGLLLDTAPADKDANDKDEDKDGIEDAKEGVATVAALGSAPAIEIGSAGALTLGAIGSGDLAFGFVNRGAVLADGLNDGVAATAVRIAAAGGTVTIQGGFNNSGNVKSQAYGAVSTAIQLGSGANAPTLRNTGLIEANQTGGKHDARAVIDASGSLSLVENLGTIKASLAAKTGETVTGKAVALDLSANTGGATVRQTKATSTSTPTILGEVRFGSGADRLELLGGSLSGDISFGAGADTLVIDGGAVASGRLVDTDGLLALDLKDGRLALANTTPLQLSSLALGAKGVLAVTIDEAAGAASRLNVSGTASLASGAQLDLTVVSLVKGPKSYEIVRAGTLQGAAATATVVGSPFLYKTTLRADQAANAIFVDVAPKTAAELGLNRSGAQAYSAVFAALDRNDSIEATVLAQKTQAGFTAAFDQMLPDHSGGALLSARAISSAISSAVAQAPSHADGGATGVWAQQIFFQIDRDREAAQGFESQGFGLAGGAELVGETQALGLNVSFVSDEYKDKSAAVGERVVMNFYGAGAYWRVRAGGLEAGARAGLGYVTFDSDRRFVSTAADVRSTADWKGWVAEAHVGAAYEMRLGMFSIRPQLALDYVRLTEDAYREGGGGAGFDLTVDERQGDLLTGEALVAFGARFGDQSWIQPEVKVGYRTKLAGDVGRTTARFGTDTPFVLDAEEVFEGGMVARVGFRGGGQRLLYSLDAGGVFDDGYSESDVRAVIRYLF